VDRCAVTDERVAESPDHSTVESNDEGPDYVHSTSLQFERELDVLNECLARLREEKESAEETGLTGAILAAESEIEDTVSRIQFLRKRIDCIEKGYEFWDRFGLEMACEACCMWVSWMDLGHADEDGQLTFNENVNVRIPIEVQRKLGLATDTGLFRKFLLCEIFEIPDHEWEIASESIYYLFGSSDSDEHELFLVAGWTVNKDDVTVW
jgi:hypothetical protein